MTVEKLTQVYDAPGNNDIQVPPGVSIIMLADGSFWKGITGGGPLTTPPTDVTLVANTSSQILTADDSRQGARIVNFGPSPIYLSQVDPPAMGPPSDFCPPATMDDNGVIWPAQFTFDFAPTADWFALTPEDGSASIFIW